MPSARRFGAVLDVFRLAHVRLRPAGAIGALVHLAAGAEIADARILGRAERAGVEAVAATDAGILRVQHHGIFRGVEAIDRTDGGTGRVVAMHAGHGDRTLARQAVIDGDDAPTVDAPGNLMLVLARGHAGLTLDAAIGVAEEFHSRHCIILPQAASIWQSVTLPSCMPVTGS